MDLRRGITMAVDSVVTNLKSRARMISTSEEIAQVSAHFSIWCRSIYCCSERYSRLLTLSNSMKVGTISANGEREIGELIAKAMEKVGKEGVITIQVSY